MAMSRSLTRIFIASSVETLSIANAVQENLDRHFETVVWDQNVFKASEYSLESLFNELDGAHFGIFILGPDDLIKIRGDEFVSPRDNVIFEMGMFAGRLGRQRVFFLVPRDMKNLRLPTDLSGVSPEEYSTDRRDGNWRAALAPACNRIRSLIHERGQNREWKAEIIHTGVFNDFVEIFRDLFSKSKGEITTYFIHSRRWRENHDAEIRAHLERGGQFFIYLPDLKIKNLMNAISDSFDDGHAIPSMVRDAYVYCGRLMDRYGDRVSVRLYSKFPTYSFYQFDDDIVFAFYTNTVARRPVPTFHVRRFGTFSSFFDKEIGGLEQETRLLSEDDLKFIKKRAK